MEVVTPKRGISWCHMYDDTLRNIVGQLVQGERGIVLPGERRTSWHTFKWVVTLTSAGWVESGSVDRVEQGEGET
jgi:hypothetical protein